MSLRRLNSNVKSIQSPTPAKDYQLDWCRHKGWEYKLRGWTRTVQRGETIDVERINEIGWLFGIQVLSDDCYGGVTLQFQGGDLELHTVAEGHAEFGKAIGAICQDPSGWVQKYYRPNPNSTAGIFFSVLHSAGFQGTLLPYVPTTIVKLYLRSESTQASATVHCSAWSVAITNPSLFIRSLRSVIGAGTIMKIDPPLLTAGPEEVTQKGPDEKEES